MIILFMVRVLGILLICLEGSALASTMGDKRIPCIYRNFKNPSLNIDAICKIQYGLIGNTGQGYRRVTWPDGVVTIITITGGGASRQPLSSKPLSVEIDKYPASAILNCENESYTVLGNEINLKGDLCR
jgi:hypothetical protein